MGPEPTPPRERVPGALRDFDAALQLLTDRYGLRLTREDYMTRLLDGVEARVPSTAERDGAGDWIDRTVAAGARCVWITSGAIDAAAAGRLREVHDAQAARQAT